MRGCKSSENSDYLTFKQVRFFKTEGFLAGTIYDRQIDALEYGGGPRDVAFVRGRRAC